MAMTQHTAITPPTATPETSPEQPTVSVHLKVLRQDAADKPESKRWEEFRVDSPPGSTLIGALMQIQANPVTSSGHRVAPIAWESNCLEEVCGSCAMRVNGKARQACAVGVDEFGGKPIRLEPLRKFQLVRDLVVNRSRLFASLGRVQAWVPLDQDPADPEPTPSAAPPAMTGSTQKELLPLGACTGCGICMEACPQFGPSTDYVGPAVLNEVRLFNTLPVAKEVQRQRLESVMGIGGVSDCGKAQNCVQSCPAGIPLVDSIQQVARQATHHLLFGWLLNAK